MSHPDDPLKMTMARLRWPLAQTWAGLFAERVMRAFWPLASLGAGVGGALLLGLHDGLSGSMSLTLGVVVALVALGLGIVGLLQFRWPRRREAVARLDASLDGRPLAALGDEQAVGTGDAASAMLWRAHRARMATRAAGARHVPGDLRLARFDPFGLRYVALLVLVIGVAFGSAWRAGTVGAVLPGSGAGAALAQGPAWEGWVEPPRHTGLPSLYLADQDGVIRAPEGSEVTLRFYGEAGALGLSRDRLGPRRARAGGGRPGAALRDRPRRRAAHRRPARARLAGRGRRGCRARGGGRVEDRETEFDGRMSLPFEARDDYGVTQGRAVFTLDTDRLDRRHGLAAEPEPREPLRLDLPMPMSGARDAFTETLIANLSQHPWAHLPVTLRLTVTDAAGQEGMSENIEMTLPARRFFNPVAAAVIEQRRDLLWSRANAPRVAQVLRAISWEPGADLFRSNAAYLRLRVILRRLEAMIEAGGPDAPGRDEIAQALWDLGVLIEDGDIGDARERMRAAQERLSEAMKNGASEDEIARLMQELRDATRDYLNQKMQQAQRDPSEQGDRQSAENSMEMSAQDLQDMMDRIEELMEQGRFAEAQQALEEFRRMMENMQVTEGQGGSEGQQAMEGLAETLRNQQGLSDQAFRDLQEQFNPGAGAGRSGENEGSSGGEGRGQSHDGAPGRGVAPAARNPGAMATGRSPTGRRRCAASSRRSATGCRSWVARPARPPAARWSAPNGPWKAPERRCATTTSPGRSRSRPTRWRRSARACATWARRWRARAAPGGPGQAQGGPGRAGADPLGREAGQGRRAGTQDNLLQGEDVYRRARDLLDELRRRSGEGERPDVELDYLRRLLDRF